MIIAVLANPAILVKGMGGEAHGNHGVGTVGFKASKISIQPSGFIYVSAQIMTERNFIFHFNSFWA